MYEQITGIGINNPEPMTDKSWTSLKSLSSNENIAMPVNETPQTQLKTNQEINAQIRAQRQQLINAQIISNMDADPVMYNRAKKVASSLGLDDIETVFNNLPTFEAQAKEKELKRWSTLSPAINKSIEQDPEFVRVSNMNFEQLAKINRNLAIYGKEDRKDVFFPYFKEMIYSYTSHDKQLQNYKKAYDMMNNLELRDQFNLDDIQKLKKELDEMPALDTSTWYPDDLLLNTLEQSPYMKRTVLPSMALTTGGAIVGSLGGPGGAAGGALAGKVTGSIVAFHETRKIEAGGMFLDLMEIKDKEGRRLDPYAAKMVSEIYGVLAGGVEMIPLKAFTNTIPGFKNLTKVGLKNAIKEAVKDKTKRQILLEIGKDYLKAVTAEGGEETVQELLGVVGERLLKGIHNLQGYSFENNKIEDDISRIVEAGIQGTKASLFLTGASTGVRVYTDLKTHKNIQEIQAMEKGKFAKAQYDIKVMDNIQKNIAGLGVNQDSLGTYKSFMQRATQNSLYKDIFIEAEDAFALMQTPAVQENMEALTQTGLIADINRQIEESKNTGAPIRIGISDFATTVMPNVKLYNAFKDVIKTYADGVTLKQVKARNQMMKGLVEQGRKIQKERLADFEMAYNKILENEIIGNMPAGQRKEIAQMNAYFLLGLSQRENIPIKELLQEQAPNFNRSFDGSIGGSNANLKAVIDTLREQSHDQSEQNLINAASQAVRRDINGIKKALSKRIQNPTGTDIKSYLRLVNAISDLKLNIENMTDEDVINQLNNYTTSSDLKIDLKRDESDRTKSGLFSSTEQALNNIQSDVGQDYVIVAGGRVPVQYEVVDLKDIQTSHYADGRVNPAYPTIMQPRDRNRDASAAQINEIASNFTPERVGKNVIANEGAPIVTKDGYVAVGNGRAMAINRVYESPETAQKYKAFIETLGYNTQGIERPILIRRLGLDLSPGEIAALVDAANTSGTMNYSESETAVRDASKLTTQILNALDPEAALDSAANKRFVQAFFNEVIPTSERNAFLDKDDMVTKKGIERIENALVGTIVPDTGFLSVLVENPDNNIRKVTAGLAKAAPAILSLEKEILSGRVSAEYSLMDDTKKAVQVLKRAKDKNLIPADYLAIKDMFEEPVSGETRAIVQLFDQARSAGAFAEQIQHYVNRAIEESEVSQGNLLGEEPKSRLSLLDEILKQEKFFQIENQLFEPTRIEKNNYLRDIKKAELSDKEVPIRLGALPYVYQALGIKQGKVQTNRSVLLKDTVKKHDVPMSVADRLPELYADPLIVFKSLNSSTNPDSYISVLDAYDKKGNQMIAVLSPNKRETGGYHFITSFYGKNSLKTMVQKAASESKIKYIKEKNISLLTGPNAYLSQADIYNIPDKNEIVNSFKAFYQLAYAGSRVDYDKPSLEAIGTGEGAQAHGWGLYYALNKDVAERYRKYFDLDNYFFNEDILENERQKQELLASKSKDYTKVEFLEDLLVTHNEDKINNYPIELVNWYKKEVREKALNNDYKKTQVHEVDIPENPYLLDEQKAFNEQSDFVKSKLELIFRDLPEDYLKEYPKMGVNRLKKLDFLGSEIYGALTEAYKTTENASKKLHEYGIKGITYDGQQDGRCFVIFNPDDVKVIQKFYQGNKEAYGSYTPKINAITLFRHNNLSTLIHESGHFWLETLRKYAAKETATESLKADLEIIESWLQDEFNKRYEIKKDENGNYSVINKKTHETELTDFATFDEGMHTAKHELFARAVEKYFRTQEAPSFKLRNLFLKLRRWLEDVYTDAEKLNVEVSDDVKVIFDQLLAARAEIEEFKNVNNLTALFDNADVAKMNASEFEKYQQTFSDSLTIASDERYAALAELTYKEASAEFAKQRKRVQKEVYNEWLEYPDFRALAVLRGAPLGDIKLTPITLDQEELMNLFKESGIKKLPKRTDGKDIYGPNGATIAQAANYLGMSELEVKKMLSRSVKMLKAYSNEVKRRVHVELGDPVSRLEIEQELVKSINNEKRLSLLNQELMALGRHINKRQTLVEQVLIKAAEDKIFELSVKNLKPEHYFNLSQKAAEKAFIAMNAKQFRTAYLQKEIQLRNFYLYKEAQKQKDIIDKAVRRLKQIGKKEVNPDVDQSYQDAARALLGRFYLAPALTSKQKERMGSVALWVLQQRADGYDIAIPDSFLMQIERKSYTEMTVEDFLSLSDAVQNLIHNGREIKSFELNGQRIEKEKLFEKFHDVVTKRFKAIKKSKSSRKSKTEFVGKAWRSLDAALTGLGHLSNEIDGADTNGLFNGMFLRPLSEAQTLENDLQSKYARKIVELTQKLSKETKNNLQKFIPGTKENLGAEYTLEDLISFGLNMGNKSNLERLMDGNRFSQRQIEYIKTTLKKEHWDYIQAIWDTLEGMYPLLEEHHKRISGLDIDKVFAVPVMTPYGNYRGGYYPIVYDVEQSASLAAKEVVNKDALFDNDYVRPTTSKGYTKKRQDVVKEPLRPGLSVVAQHMRAVIHDIAYRQPLRQLWSLVNDPRFIETFDNHIGKEYRETLKDLLRSIGNQPNQDIRTLGKFEQALKFFRQRATLIGLGFRISTALTQPLGFFSSIAKIAESKQKLGGKHGGAYWISVGHRELMNKEVRAWALANSGELRARLGNNDETIARRIRELQSNAGRENFKDVAEGWAYKAIGYTDFYVAMTTWLGAYRQAQIDFKMAHNDAVYYADRIMIDSQGTGNLKDTIKFQRANEAYRAMVMFYSFFAGLYQMSKQLAKDTAHIKNTSDFINVSARFMGMIVLPSLFDAMLKGEMPDDDDNIAGWLFDHVFGYYIASVPVVRDIYSGAKFKNSGTTNYNRGANYILSSFKSLSDLLDKEKTVTTKNLTKNTLNATAMITGLPMGGQVADTMSYFAAWLAGELKPRGINDILWGIYKGKERKEK